MQPAAITRFPRTARLAAIGAGALSAVLALEWTLVFHLGIVQRADAAAYYGFRDLAAHPHVEAVAGFLANLCDPYPYVLLAAVPVLVALLRRRVLVAVAIGVIILGANGTTELLKPLLAAPRPAGLPEGLAGSLGSWPSGHATASMTLVLCAMLAAPVRVRPYVAALGAAFAVAVCYSFLTLGWHYPSDALAGLLVASIWTLTAIAVLSVLEGRVRGSVRRRPQLELRTALTPPVLAAAGSLFVAGAVLAVRPAVVLEYATEHPSFLVGALALPAFGLALATGVLIALRTRT